MILKKYRVTSTQNNLAYEFEALNQSIHNLVANNLPVNKKLRFQLPKDHNLDSHEFYNKILNTLDFPHPEYFFESIE